jgi:hypothetical protein
MSEESEPYVAVQPVHPRIGTIDDVEKRLSIPSEFVKPWFKETAATDAVYCVPLLWRRPLPIAAGHELEAWYLWSRADSTRNWATDPLAVLESNGDVGNEFYLKGLMYPAILASSNRKCRLSCADLFDNLIKRAGSKFWLVQERNSVSILTDHAYQTGCGRLTF